MAVARIDSWSILECPLSTKQLLTMSEGTGLLDTVKTKCKEFVRVAPNYELVNKAVVLDTVFGIDFLLEVDMGDENSLYLAIDVTTQDWQLIPKLKKQRSKSRTALRSKLGLDGFLIIGIDRNVFSESGFSNATLKLLRLEVEGALRKGSPYVWVG